MSTNQQTDPRDRSAESWRARLAVLASRGETDGPRVDECRSALAWWRASKFFSKEIERGHLDGDTAAHLLDLMRGAR